MSEKNNTKEMKNYEMMLILKPLLPDDLRKEIHKELVEFFEQDAGELVDADVWGKRYLSYPIKGHGEGYYIVYNFKLNPSHIAELRRRIQLKQEILRFMITEKEDVSRVGKRIKKKEMKI